VSRDIKTSLEKTRPLTHRMQIVQAGGLTILNDTYNANPDSVASALETLNSMQCDGKKIVILGDMLELGDFTQLEHEKIGKLINRLGFEYVLTIGRAAKFITENVKGKVNLHYNRKELLAESTAELTSPGDIVLVKGSHGMKMEDVVALLHKRIGRRML